MRMKQKAVSACYNFNGKGFCIAQECAFIACWFTRFNWPLHADEGKGVSACYNFNGIGFCIAQECASIARYT